MTIIQLPLESKAYHGSREERFETQLNSIEVDCTESNDIAARPHINACH
jgi:hypothetical protein